MKYHLSVAMYGSICLDIDLSLCLSQELLLLNCLAYAIFFSFKINLT